MNQMNSMNPKLLWAVIGVAALIGLAYLASRVGNIGARSVRDGGTPVELSLSDPVVPGVGIKVAWTTGLGEGATPVVIRVRSRGEEVVLGQGEFATGQAMIALPCELGGENVGVALYELGEDGTEQLLAQRSVEVLPAGPDCLR